MSEFGSEVSSSEVSGDSGTVSDVDEVDTGTEVSGSEMDKDLSNELDDSYDLYIEGQGLSSYEKGKASEVDESGTETENLDFEVNNHYNKYIDEGEKLDSPENIKDGLTEPEKERLKEETGWSDEIVDSTRSVEEAEIYKSADLKEDEINGKRCLIRSNIDMEQKDEFGRTNKERMENGNAPLTRSGETVELHHIGQKQDSPLAELTTQEHRGKGNDTILHDKQKETEIDRGEFAKERKQHWESRAENT